MKVYIFGTGETEKRFREENREYWEKLDILGYLDNAIEKQGTIYEGIKVFSPDILLDVKPDEYDLIIVMSIHYLQIRSQLINQYKVESKKIENQFYLSKLRLQERYQNCKDIEIQKIITYLAEHPLDVFNYDFVHKYYDLEFEVCVDKESGFPYLYDNKIQKRVFFPKNWSEKEIKNYYIHVLFEQDKESPHCYSKEGYEVRDNDIVVDIGVAEGNFALSVVDRVKKLYMIECEKDWGDALRLTFEPYKHKVEIIQSFVSDCDADKMNRLDSLVKETVDVIKMDIEGAEVAALKGVDKVIDERTRFIVCTYHKENDACLLKNFFEINKYITAFSKGYMWFYGGNDLRKGLIFAKKERT